MPENTKNWGILQECFVVPPERFAVSSVWDALWIPSWYALDQSLIAGEEKESLFLVVYSSWLSEYFSERKIPTPALVFDNLLSSRKEQIYVLKGKILYIQNNHFGSIKSLVNKGFDYEMTLESGEGYTINSEEEPGAIWNETDKAWNKSSQNYDWSMLVRFQILDRDPKKIFGVASSPKSLCSDVCAAAPGSVLHDAAQDGNIEKIRQLIGEGIDINGKNEFGDTALFRAARRGHTEIVRLLLDSGANPNLQNHAGWNSLHTASVQGYTDIVKMLLDAGIYVDNRNKNGWTPLFLAAGSGHVEIVRMLLEAVADIHAEDANGNTPIPTAQKKGYQEVVKLLKGVEKK